MPPRSLVFTVIQERLGICRLAAGVDVPLWALSPIFSSVTVTADETSIICPEAEVPTGVKCDRGWLAIKIESPLDLSEVGIVLSLASPLANAGVSIFVVSTYETDYVLVREGQLRTALSALAEDGHTLRE